MILNKISMTIIFLAVTIAFFQSCGTKSAPSSPASQPTATSTVCANAQGTPCTATFTMTATSTATVTQTLTATSSPTITYTLTNTHTSTVTSSMTMTSTPTVTSTPASTAVACSTAAVVGYTGISTYYVSFGYGVVLTKMTLVQASDINSFVIAAYGYLGGAFQPVIYSDTGSNYPNAVIYQAPTTVTASGLITIPVSPSFSLPSGTYWVGFYSATSLGTADADSNTTNAYYYTVAEYNSNPVPLSAFSPFPSGTNSTFAVGQAGGLVGNLGVQLNTCHP